MSVIKYRKKGESTWKKLSNMMVNAFNIVQGKGTSTVDIMSQKAVSDELDTKQDISGMTDYYTKDNLTGSSAIAVALAESATTSESADTALALAASSAASATTNDYVLLEDSNGSPIKIKTDSLIQALSNILYSNDKGQSVSGALVQGTDGQFGGTTISNLASVLGDIPNFVFRYLFTSYRGSVNDLYKGGIYLTAGHISDLPNNANGVVVVFGDVYGNYTGQLFFDVEYDHFHLRNHSGSLWHSWRQIY